jgi:hypothetical protein
LPRTTLSDPLAPNAKNMARSPKSEPKKPDELAFKFDRAMPARFFFDRVKSN